MFSLFQQTTPVVVQDTAPPDAIVVVEGADHVVTEGGNATHGAAVTHVADGHAVEVATTAHDTGHAVGMPQLDFSTFGNQIFWLLVTLALLYWVLSKIALPRIGAVISDRQGAITGDLMQAEEFKKKARDAEAAYDKALADARVEANKIVASQKAEIQKDLDGSIAQADAEIAARTAESEKRIGAIHQSSATDARSVAREVTAELVRAFGGRADDAAIDAAVDAHLKGAS